MSPYCSSLNELSTNVLIYGTVGKLSKKYGFLSNGEKSCTYLINLLYESFTLFNLSWGVMFIVVLNISIMSKSSCVLFFKFSNSIVANSVIVLLLNEFKKVVYLLLSHISDNIDDMDLLVYGDTSHNWNSVEILLLFWNFSSFSKTILTFATPPSLSALLSTLLVATAA